MHIGGEDCGNTAGSVCTACLATILEPMAVKNGLPQFHAGPKHNRPGLKPKYFELVDLEKPEHCRSRIYGSGPVISPPGATQREYLYRHRRPGVTKSRSVPLARHRLAPCQGA
jgi:hypothetical protein